MTFADEIEKQSSERFVLSRLEPARFINDNLQSIGGNLYQATFEGTIVSKIERSGVALTSVASPSSNGEYSFDESTGLLTIYSTSAPDTSDNIFILFFYLFYSTDYDRLYPQDVDSGVDRCWSGRIKSQPTFNQNVTNITTDSKITSSAAPLKIENTDRYFNRTVEQPSKFSFKNKNIKIWLVVNSKIQSLTEGTTTSISIGRDVSISFNDSLKSILDNPAFMGDSFDECVSTASKYPNIYPKHTNKSIPLLLGNSTPVSYDISQEEWTFADSRKTYKGINISSTGSSLTDNRSWVLCRIPADQSLISKTPTFVGVGTALTFANSDTLTVRFDALKGHGIVVGDRFEFFADGVTNYAVVFKISDRLAAPGEDEISAYSTYTGPQFFGFSSLVFPAIPNITILKGSDHYQPFHRDYSVSLTATSGGNQLVTVTLDDNFETIDTSGTGLNDTLSVRSGSNVNFQLTSSINTSSPTNSIDLTNSNNVAGSDMLYHVQTTGGNINHSHVLEKIFSSSGLATNSGSFSQAESDLDADVYMTIPMIGESDYKGYNKYAEAILGSTFGIAYLNSNNEISYSLFNSSGNQSVSLSDDNILKGSFSSKINYGDISTEFQLDNDHVGDELIEKLNSSSIIENKISKHLHQTDKRDNIKHVLADLTNVISASGQLTKKLSWLQSPTILYTFKTSSDQLLTNINDRSNINSCDVLGDENSTENKVVSYSKGPDSTTITTIDVTEL